MRFTVASVLAFAAAVLAAESKDKKFDPINVPTFNEVIPAGKPFTVEWENPAPYTEGPVTIQLFAGKDGNSLVAKGDVIAKLDSKDKKYTWAVDASLGDEAAYGLKLVWSKDEEIYQWSNPFTIKKAEGGSTVTMTSSQGTKTITLSSTTSSTTTTTTTTTTSSTTTECTTTSAHHNATASHNSTTVAPTMTKTTSLAPTDSASTTAPVTKPSNGAAAHAAGSIAVVGGLVAALLAL